MVDGNSWRRGRFNFLNVGFVLDFFGGDWIDFSTVFSSEPSGGSLKSFGTTSLLATFINNVAENENVLSNQR